MVRFGALEHCEAALPLSREVPAAERQRKSRSARRSNVRPADKRMIAWDGEGINLSGDGKPQHYVLFGCSARVNDPLVVTHPEDTLTFLQIADYMLETKERFPDAYHVGYSFKYDQNMIIRTLRWSVKRELYQNGKAWVRKDKWTRYKVEWVPGKTIAITRVRKARNGDRVSTYIKVEDIFAFYASSFVNAYQKTFPGADDEESWRTIVEGKASRGGNKWEDMPEVRRYWEAEILALEKLATGLRDMLWDNGFYLKQWYGPGAFANYIRRTFRLDLHEWGGKEENLPSSRLHDAIKSAYYGGHFEQYQGGHVRETVYGYDINSAYPAAFCTLPSMREGGFWQELSLLDAVKDSRNPSSPLTVYYVQFRGPRARNPYRAGITKPMPLPFRDSKGNVTYEPRLDGWYWSPEVTAILNSRRWNNDEYKLHITQAWRWVAADNTYPWKAVIEPMFEKRLQLKRAGNPAEMVFKLGPNSLYGKMAQRVGFTEADPDQPDSVARPPRAHTLCIAGYLTSWCRANILRMLDAIDDDQLIAVETDGVYTTAPPEQITERWPDVVFSKALGDWGMDIYDEVIYLQNGVYLKCNDGKWEAKTRGVSAASLTFDKVSPYIKSCLPGEAWAPLKVDQGQQFMGLGLAILRATEGNGNLIQTKANNMHCVWYPDEKDISPTGAVNSKRMHQAKHCEACKIGLSLDDGLHPLVIRSRTTPNGFISQPYRLPWETKEKESWRDQIGVIGDRQSDAPRVTPRRHPHNRPAHR